MADNITIVTPSALFYDAGKASVSLHEAKVKACAQLAEKKDAWAQELLNYANGGGLLDKVKRSPT